MFNKVIRPATLLVAIALLTGSTAATRYSLTHRTDKKTINIKNTTKFTVDQIFISPDDEDHWGDDIMDDDEILKPGEAVDVEVDCGKWDVKLVADDDSECKIEDVTLCKSDQWNIVADCEK